MKGFKIEINNKKIDAAVYNGVILVVVEKAIGITGTDRALGLSVDWGYYMLNHGDKIRITASSNIETNTPPISTKPLSRQELLAEYYNLKKILIKEGVLK
ncbi:MAG: hypothetical protein LBV43_06395 [Prevotella sp.]|jgi:hypothetical protein|nr:hypothetical protein [Prevotella sp.]